jgi:hypothetical protein
MGARRSFVRVTPLAYVTLVSSPCCTAGLHEAHREQGCIGGLLRRAYFVGEDARADLHSNAHVGVLTKASAVIWVQTNFSIRDLCQALIVAAHTI